MQVHPVELATDTPGVGRLDPPATPMPVTGPSRDREGSKPRQRRKKKKEEPPKEGGGGDGPKGKRIDIRA